MKINLATSQLHFQKQLQKPDSYTFMCRNSQNKKVICEKYFIHIYFGKYWKLINYISTTSLCYYKLYIKITSCTYLNITTKKMHTQNMKVALASNSCCSLLLYDSYRWHSNARICCKVLIFVFYSRTVLTYECRGRIMFWCI